MPGTHDPPDYFTMSLEELMNVTIVTTSKKTEEIKDTSSVVSTISAKEIAMYGGNTLLEVLERSPSFYSLGTYSYPDNVMSMRGDLAPHYNTRVLILINGRPSREPHTGGVDVGILASFPLDIIEKIEVIRGPGSVLYGSNAYAGVINIITKTAKETASSYEIGIGSFETKYARATTYAVKGDLKVTTGFNYLNSKGWDFEAIGEPSLNYDGTPANRDVSKDYGQHNMSAFVFAKYGNLNVDLLYAGSEKSNLGTIPMRVFPGPTSAPPINKLQPFANRVIDSERFFANIGYKHEISDYYYQTYNLTYNDHHFNLLAPPGEVDVTVDDILGEFTGFHTLNDSFDWIYGGTIYYITGIQKIGDSDPESNGVAKYADTWYSAYLECHYNFNPDLKITGGIQVNKPHNSEGKLVPRLGSIYNFTDNLGMKLQYAEAYRAPYRLETGLHGAGILEGNADLEPETTATIDAQIFYHGANYHWALTYFNTRQEDLITRIGASPATFINANKLNIQGAEIEGKWSPRFLRKLFINGSISYQENELKDDASAFPIGTDKIEDFTHMPNLLAKLGLSYDFTDTFSAGLFNTYVDDAGDVADVNPSRELVNPPAKGYNFMTLNMRLNVKNIVDTKEDIYLELYCYNLLDESIYYPEYARRKINTLPGRSGRAVYVSLKMDI